MAFFYCYTAKYLNNLKDKLIFTDHQISRSTTLR